MYIILLQDLALVSIPEVGLSGYLLSKVAGYCIIP